MATETASRMLAQTLADLLDTGVTGEEMEALLEELQPYDIAAAAAELSDQHQPLLLSMLSPGLAAAVVEQLEYPDQYRILDHMAAESARAVLTQMSGDDIVDLVGAIHPRQAEQLLKWLPDELLPEIRSLMSYPRHTAGGRMTVDYISVRANWTAEQVLRHIRKVGAEAETISYVYVVDRAGRLVGVASLREIIMTSPATPINEAMFTQIVSVAATADQEEAANLLRQYDFVALPVVTAGGTLVGIVTVDDVFDVIEEETTEDISRLSGSEPLGEPYLQATLLALVKKRLGWLLLLFVAQSMTANILRHYQDYLNQVVALTFFIPMLIGTAGNAGSQASTLVVRAMAVGEVDYRDFFTVVWRETRVAAIMGTVLATAMFIRAEMMGGGPGLGLTVATTVVVVVLVTSVVGTALPLVSRKLGLDPATVSAPLITTVADAVGLLIYMNLARMLLNLSP